MRLIVRAGRGCAQCGLGSDLAEAGALQPRFICVDCCGVPPGLH